MYTVTTKTMKINGQTKKVFMLRGDEAYARSTDTALSYSNLVTGDIRGFKIDLTVNLYRTIGSSTVLIYDGDTVIKSVNVASNQSSVTISNVYLSYNVEHSLQAVYQGNSQCLKSKSKRIALTEPLPSSLATSIEFVDAPTQVSVDSDATLNLYAHIDNVAVPDGTPILLYVDDELIGQEDTSDGSATIHTGALELGLHNIQAVIEQSATVNRVESEIQISSGVNITYDSVPTVFYNGMDNTVKIRVNDWYGNGVSGANVSFNSTTTTTGSNGIATFSPRNMVNGETYTATSNGCSVSKVMNAITITGVDVELVQDGVCALNYTEPLTITISGEGYTGAIPTTITDGANTSTVNIVPNTSYAYEYQGRGGGDVEVTATCGTASDSVIIEDMLSGYKAMDYEYNLIMAKNVLNVTKDSNGILITTKNTLNGDVTFYTEETPSSIEFNVKGCQNGQYLKFGLLNGGNYSFGNITALDKVKIVRENTTLNYYLNNELVYTNQVGDGVTNVWQIKFSDIPLTEKLETRIRIDELKIK